jgi:hypothetical protein
MSTTTPHANNGTAQDGAAARSTNGRFVPPPPPPAPSSDRPSELPRHLKSSARWTGRQLLRPRVRTGLIGAVLIVVGLAFVDGTWSTLLTVAGVVLLLVAYAGARMRGRFLVEWGENGTKLEFDAGVKPAPEPAALTKPTLNAPRTSAGPALAAAPQQQDAIEGEAHTVEIDVAELQALIAAAERAEAGKAA